MAALADGLRRAMYDFARQQRRPITRDDAAEAVGISRKLAAFHLDKLVDVGLLRVVTPSAQEQPRRRGRAPKRYEASERRVDVTIPPRRYDLMGEVLVDAVGGGPQIEEVRRAGRRLAKRRGREIGKAFSSRRGLRRPGPERTLRAASVVLTDLGFEPVVAGPCLLLRNCPFHHLATRSPELVCHLNQAMLAGLVEGMGARRVDAVLAPHAGRCCVELRTREQSPGRSPS